MDWLQAVSSWIGSLAWPAAVITLAVLLKAPLSTALSTLRHIEAPGVKADFGTTIKDVEDRAENLKESLPDGTAKPLPAEPDTTVDHSAEHDPSGVILRSFQQLNDEVVKLAEATGVQQNKRRNFRALVHLFQVSGFLERDATITLLELSDLRNRVAHGGHTPTPGEAITYRTAAENVRSYVAFTLDHVRTHGRGDESMPQTDDPSRA